MTRPLLFDITHLTNRLSAAAPSGVDRVDLAFARHFAARTPGIAGALHYGRGRPSLWGPEKLGGLVGRADRRWREQLSADDDPVFARARAWLLGGEPAPLAPARALFPTAAPGLVMQGHLMRARLGLGPSVPRNALYLNVAQHALEHAVYFRWLASRPDIRAVFFLHDLLPLDFPEFWWAGHEALFQRRMDNMFRHAGALITTSATVRARALEELRRRGLPEIPILAHPLPSPLANASTPDPALAERPYFVVVGTIEPRKNHLLLLNAWRDLARAASPAPKLVVVGARGWENEQAIDMLERCRDIAGLVHETTGLSNAGLRRLIVNARAVLVPSFAEGFGLPLVEALSLGAPTIASDIPVFREVAQDAALFREPTDGPGGGTPSWPWRIRLRRWRARRGRGQGGSDPSRRLVFCRGRAILG